MMEAALRTLVWKRARGRCEYCQLRQDDYEFQTFHVEHVIAKQHGGNDDSDNLCLSCSECNWAKGPNLAGLLDGKLIPLFHPRRQQWKRHFRWDGTLLVGRTKSGIVTVRVLNMNDAARIMLRENLLIRRPFPADSVVNSLISFPGSAWKPGEINKPAGAERTLPLRWLLHHLRDAAGADGASAFADRELAARVERPVIPAELTSPPEPR